MWLPQFALLAISFFKYSSAANSNDPCTLIGNGPWVSPAAVRACFQSFPFNEDHRQNVLQAIGAMLNFYALENYYLSLPAPFQDSSVNIRDKLMEISRTSYQNDYDFNMAVYNAMRSLNDGVTNWSPTCYTGGVWSILPAPLISVQVDGGESVLIAPESDKLLTWEFGSQFDDYFQSINFDWKSLAGAKVVSIEGLNPYEHLQALTNGSGTSLDSGVGINSMLSSYEKQPAGYMLTFGGFMNQRTVEKDSVTMELILAGQSTSQTITVPFATLIPGVPITDSQSYWASHCAANAFTNGERQRPPRPKGHDRSIHYRTTFQVNSTGHARSGQHHLPPPYPLPGVQPSNPIVDREFFQSYILPDGKTGVFAIHFFLDSVLQQSVVESIKAFKAAGVTQLLIDLTNNRGGDSCLAQFLYAYLSASGIGNTPGFISVFRSNPLALKIVPLIRPSQSFRFLNGTQMPPGFNYFVPSVDTTINGKSDSTTQQILDTCELTFAQEIPAQPPFDLQKVAIVSDGVCLGACAEFQTLMLERHDTLTTVFGPRQDMNIQCKGATSSSPLLWSELKTGLRAANLQNDLFAPPDLLISGDIHVAWQLLLSWKDKTTPIEYESRPPNLHLSHTLDTYNNPMNTWTVAAGFMFH